MAMRRPVVSRFRALLPAAALLLPAVAAAQAGGGSSVALSGVVRSLAEGWMEGVVVTVRREGAPFTVSVVSDARGRYRFPRTHLEPGTYDVTMRAAGYDLASPGRVAVTATAAATLDLELTETGDLASQLSSREWLMSMPGSVAQKDQLAYQVVSCAYCHTYERIVKSRHTAERFVP